MYRKPLVEKLSKIIADVVTRALKVGIEKFNEYYDLIFTLQDLCGDFVSFEGLKHKEVYISDLPVFHITSWPIPINFSISYIKSYVGNFEYNWVCPVININSKRILSFQLISNLRKLIATGKIRRYVSKESYDTIVNLLNSFKTRCREIWRLADVCDRVTFTPNRRYYYEFLNTMGSPGSYGVLTDDEIYKIGENVCEFVQKTASLPKNVTDVDISLDYVDYDNYIIRGKLGISWGISTALVKHLTKPTVASCLTSIGGNSACEEGVTSFRDRVLNVMTSICTLKEITVSDLLRLCDYTSSTIDYFIRLMKEVHEVIT